MAAGAPPFDLVLMAGTRGTHVPDATTSPPPQAGNGADRSGPRRMSSRRIGLAMIGVFAAAVVLGIAVMLI